MESNGSSEQQGRSDLAALVSMIFLGDQEKIRASVEKNGENWRNHISPDIVNRAILFAVLAQTAELTELVARTAKKHDPDRPRVVVP